MVLGNKGWLAGECEEIILVDPGPEAMVWMKEQIWIALKWNDEQEGAWHLLGVLDELWDYDQNDFGIWIWYVSLQPQWQVYLQGNLISL